MKMNFSVVVFLAVLAVACGRNPIGPTDSGTWKNPNGVPGGWPEGTNPAPDPNAEHYISADGLIEMYVKGIFPSRGGTVVPGQRAEIYFQVIYKGTDQSFVLMPSVVDSPSDKPGQPGRNSAIFNGGTVLQPGANRMIVFGTFSAPVAENIPFVRFCAYRESRFLSWCDINVEVNWQ
ncbi:MAG: hypothetical protein HYT67_01640 [Candidatus Yanofskybacteria bacterium]|nr:hypothetical protein [Candidatus Yanofskybacteria bacterium]